MSEQTALTTTTEAPIQPASPGPAKKPVKPRGFPYVPVLIILLAGVPLGYVFIKWNRAAMDAPGRFFDAISDVVRPKINVNQIVLTSIGDLHKEARLVVLKTSVTADVTRDETYTHWGIYWGTNTARVIAPNAQVQYYIDLSAVGTSNYVYDEASKSLTLTLPPPKLDTDFSIDPSKIQVPDLRSGWNRWDKDETKDNAVKDLFPALLIQARSPLLLKEAREDGIEAMENWLKPLADTLAKDGVTLVVKYKEPA